MSRLLVISADCHAGLPPERYRDYVDPQYREVFDAALPVQIQVIEENDAKFLKQEFLEAWRTEDVAHGLTGAWDSAERDRQLDGDGIAGEIIFPDGVTGGNLPPFGATLSLFNDRMRPEIVPELQWAGARAHNRWIAEFCQESAARRAGLALVPLLYDVDAAVREAHWAREHGLRGILIPALFDGYPPYHDPRYEPFWAACAELDLPIHTHGGAAPDYGDAPGTIGIYITEVHWWSARPAWFLIWGGVFERHPRLKFVVTELGASWVPELKALMDQRFSDTHFAKKLGDYRSQFQARWTAQFRQPTAPSLLQCHHGFSQRLDQAIVQQQAQCRQQAQRVQRARDVLRQKEQRVAAVQKLIERRLTVQQRQAERRDQKQTDEAAQRTAWAKAATADLT